MGFSLSDAPEMSIPESLSYEVLLPYVPKSVIAPAREVSFLRILLLLSRGLQKGGAVRLPGAGPALSPKGPDLGNPTCTLQDRSEGPSCLARGHLPTAFGMSVYPQPGDVPT